LVRRDQPELGVELDIPVPGGEAVALVPPMVLGEHPPVERGEDRAIRDMSSKDATLFR